MPRCSWLPTQGIETRENGSKGVQEKRKGKRDEGAALGDDGRQDSEGGWERWGFKYYAGHQVGGRRLAGVRRRQGIGSEGSGV